MGWMNRTFKYIYLSPILAVQRLMQYKSGVSIVPNFVANRCQARPDHMFVGIFRFVSFSQRRRVSFYCQMHKWRGRGGHSGNPTACTQIRKPIIIHNCTSGKGRAGHGGGQDAPNAADSISKTLNPMMIRPQNLDDKPFG